jgi:hypothetical protein
MFINEHPWHQHLLMGQEESQELEHGGPNHSLSKYSFLALLCQPSYALTWIGHSV